MSALETELEMLRKENQKLEKANRKLQGRISTLEQAVRKHKKQSKKIKARIDNNETEVLVLLELEMESQLKDLQEECLVEVESKPFQEEVDKFDFMKKLKKEVLNPKPETEFIELNGKKVPVCGKLRYKEKV